MSIVLVGIVVVDDLCFGDPCYVVALTFASLKAFGPADPLSIFDQMRRCDLSQRAWNARKTSIASMPVSAFLSVPVIPFLISYS